MDRQLILYACQGCHRRWFLIKYLHGQHCLWCGVSCAACTIERLAFLVEIKRTGIVSRKGL